MPLKEWKMSNSLSNVKREHENKETIDIIKNPYIMKQIIKSEKNINKGKIKKIDF